MIYVWELLVSKEQYPVLFFVQDHLYIGLLEIFATEVETDGITQVSLSSSEGQVCWLRFPNAAYMAFFYRKNT